VLVDTSVWSLALRRKPGQLGDVEGALADELAELIREQRVVLVGPVRQELLSGVKPEPTFQRLRQALQPFPDEPLTTEDFEEAARAHNRCRAAGVAGSAVDFLLCAVAQRRGLALFTTDHDFERYARRLPLTLHGPRQSA